MKKIVSLSTIVFMVQNVNSGIYQNAFNMVFRKDFPLALAIYASTTNKSERAAMAKDSDVQEFLKENYRGKTLDDLTAAITKFKKDLKDAGDDQGELKKVFASLFQDDGQPGKEIITKWGKDTVVKAIK